MNSCEVLPKTELINIACNGTRIIHYHSLRMQNMDVLANVFLLLGSFSLIILHYSSNCDAWRFKCLKSQASMKYEAEANYSNSTLEGLFKCLLTVYWMQNADFCVHALSHDPSFHQMCIRNCVQMFTDLLWKCAYALLCASEVFLICLSTLTIDGVTLGEEERVLSQ